MAVAGADVEQLEDAPTHEHLERQGKTISNITKKTSLSEIIHILKQSIQWSLHGNGHPVLFFSPFLVLSEAALKSVGVLGRGEEVCDHEQFEQKARDESPEKMERMRVRLLLLLLDWRARFPFL